MSELALPSAVARHRRVVAAKPLAAHGLALRSLNHHCCPRPVQVLAGCLCWQVCMRVTAAPVVACLLQRHRHGSMCRCHCRCCCRHGRLACAWPGGSVSVLSQSPPPLLQTSDHFRWALSSQNSHRQPQGPQPPLPLLLLMLVPAYAARPSLCSMQMAHPLVLRPMQARYPEEPAGPLRPALLQ